MADNIIIEPVIYQVTATEENKVIVVSQPGAQGLQGPSGPSGPSGSQGPSGPSGPQGTSGGSYAFEQQTIATTWNITHNLGYRPSVSIRDYGGTNLECDIQHDSVNSLTLTLLIPTAGYAYFS